MTCFFCKGDMVQGYTNYMTELDGHFIIIKNVPCMKCNQCGEESFSGTTVEKIDSIILKLRNMLTEVAIVDYAA